MSTDTEAAPTEEADGPVRFMHQHIALDYVLRISPIATRFAEQLAGGRIVGQGCPECGLVFVPPRTFCPMCVVGMGPEHEVTVADRGTVTSFTVLTPIQYHGQKEREDYALASILLDGADGTVGQQRILDLPVEQVRTGLRVEAVWASEEERTADTYSAMGYGFGTAITGWRPTGEPDVEKSKFKDHVL